MSATRTTEVVADAAGRQRQTVLWIIAVLLAIIATAVVVRPASSFAPSLAYADAPMAGARGVFAFTGQLDKDNYGLFMMDVDSGNIWCYQYLPLTRKLKLVAARSFAYDRYLEDYSCAEPTIKMVKEMLNEGRRVQERIGGGLIAPDDEEEAEDEEALGTSMPGFPP